MATCRAADTKLNRDVAMKVLPEPFAADPDRLARFTREAQVLASLNHPNTTVIYGVGERALVLELVEGPTLAERIAQGPLPVEDALRIARQIAEALEYAHGRGIVHRDLKPANVKLTGEGSVKVAAADPISSSTLTISATAAGAIMGTPAYMSPEQAKSNPVDQRADVWAFGVVLYEMLTGRQMYSGATASEILAAVILAEPDFEKLPGDTPAAIRKLLRRCLTKDYRRRLQAIGEARVAIEDALSGVASDEAPLPVKAPHLRWASLGLGCDFGGRVLRRTMGMATPAGGTTPFRSPLHHDAAGRLKDHSSQAFSRRLPPGVQGPIWPDLHTPDGPTPVQTAGGHRGRPQLLVLTGRAMAWIPRWRKVPKNSCEWRRFCSGYGRGSRWAGTAFSGCRMTRSCLQRMGRSCAFRLWEENPKWLRPLTQTSALLIRLQQALPDGRRLLFTRRWGPEDKPLSILDLHSGRKKQLIEAANWGGYAPTGDGKGHIIYRAAESLFAVPFDPARLEITGSPAPVVEGVRRWQGNPLVDFSDSGVLIYVPATVDPEPQRTLVWVDRKGSATPLRAPPHGYLFPRISPDGERVAVQFTRPGRETLIGVFDLPRATFTQLTFQGNNVVPIWTPDGTRLTYRSNASGLDGIFTMPADSSGPPVLLTTGNNFGVASSWSPDGKLLIGTAVSSRALWLLSVRPDGSGGEVHSLPASPFEKSEPMISPDGHWLAYASRETGRPEIYVQSFPGVGERTTISAEGGASPRWSRDGRELFYRNGDKMMAVDIRPTPAFHVDVPRVLFEGHYENGYDLSPDGKRFLMIKAGPESEPQNTELHVVVNWFEEVRRLAPGVR